MKITFISLIAFLLLVTPQLAQGQDFSENAQKRLEEIEAKRATGSAVATPAADKKTTSISFVEGSVASINGSIFLINTQEGSRIVYTTDNTKYFSIDSSGKKLSGFGDIKVGETIMVLGIVPKNNSGTARIIVRDTVKQIPTFSTLGKIIEIKDTSVTLQGLGSKDLPLLTLSLNLETKIQAGEKTLSVSELGSDDTIVAAGHIDDKGALITKTILRLKTGPKSPTATSSAQ